MSVEFHCLAADWPEDPKDAAVRDWPVCTGEECRLSKVVQLGIL